MIPRILFTNRMETVRHFLSAQPYREIDIIRVTYDKASQEIISFLQGRAPNVRVVKGAEYLPAYEKRYADFIGSLNLQYHSLPWWWALDLTNKNPITTALCNKVYYALLIPAVMKQSSAECLVVIDQDEEVYRQILRQLLPGVRTQCSIARRCTWQGLKNVVPGGIAYSVVRRIVQKCYAHVRLGARYRALLKNSPRIVIASLLYGPSFPGKQAAYRDVYFGAFVDYLKEQKVPFVNFMEVCAPYRTMVKQVLSKARDYPVFPKEIFITFKSFAQAVYHSFRRFYGHGLLRGRVMLEGIDMTFLVKTYIRKEYTSTRFFSNLLMHYAVRDIARRFSIDRWYYPFENRSFEKMMLTALERYSPATRSIGYQHASVSLRHTNFILAEGESVITPLPKHILTMGVPTKNILAQTGGFPEKLLSVGGALRQRPYLGTLKSKPAAVKNVLVALATNIEEYVKVLQFLSEAWKKSLPYTLWIRPHPVFSLEEALAIHGPMPAPFYKADKEPLEKCFEWADAVWYVHSTLSLEAMQRGIPVFCIGVDDIVNPDPLFAFEAFRWYLNRPGEVAGVIGSVDKMDSNEYAQRQEKGARYAQEYLCPADAERLKTFLTC